MNNQRKVERKTLTTFTPAYDLQKNVLLGYLGDLTLQGAMLVGTKPVEIGQNLTLAIDFHETPEIPATRLALPARTAWCRREADSAYYNTGVEFLDLSDDNRLVITVILERYQFRKITPD